jgi:hypothetical protein
LRDGEDSVTDVVVEWASIEFTGEEVVAARIKGFFAVATGGWGWLVKERETEFAAK